MNNEVAMSVCNAFSPFSHLRHEFLRRFGEKPTGLWMSLELMEFLNKILDTNLTTVFGMEVNSAFELTGFEVEMTSDNCALIISGLEWIMERSVVSG